IELDGFFTFFDFICEKYNLEKLKTIGDSYMCVGGLPAANFTHPVDACMAALEFREFAERMKELVLSSKEKMMPWELRVGLHTGPVIGGAVGTTKFAYDVWGDSVNTASRIEAACLPGKVNISGTTYSLIKDFFECEYRGKVQAKNKGEIDMYFVKGLLPDLTRDRDGVTPNEKFHIQYELLKNNKFPSKSVFETEHLNGHSQGISISQLQ
ncbi:MAG TPA: adenylate/guanylate cyclase domain-containing protein, partial [Leptospiraceae bacterium]|nr:adenylate/guanylate cyclase domain-containing protein [Leptospiraceae bacterium]